MRFNSNTPMFINFYLFILNLKLVFIKMSHFICNYQPENLFLLFTCYQILKHL